MSGSIAADGHRYRNAHGGHYWRRGEPFVPLSEELAESDSWRCLSPTGTRIALDMLGKYWRASRGDHEMPRGGFCYTYHECRVDCSPRTFTAQLKEIVRVGLFVPMPGNRVVQRFRPGNWRVFREPFLAPLPKLATRRKRPKQVKRKRGQAPCMGHFWREGELFIPIPFSLLESDAWRDLGALSACILLDMISAHNCRTYSDYVPLDDGMHFTHTQCRVGCSKGAFLNARAEITRTQWFHTPPELQRDGLIHFVPGDWRSYRAPASAQFRRKAQIKARYVKQKQARQQKGRGRFCDVQGAEIATYSETKVNIAGSDFATGYAESDDTEGAFIATLSRYTMGIPERLRTRRTLHLFRPSIPTVFPLKMLRRPTLVEKEALIRGLAVTSPDDSLAAIYDYAFGP